MPPGLPVLIVVRGLVAFFVHDLLGGTAGDGRLVLCDSKPLPVVVLHPDLAVLIRDFDGGAVAVVFVVNGDFHLCSFPPAADGQRKHSEPGLVCPQIPVSLKMGAQG